MNRDSTYEMFPRLKEKEKYLIDIINYSFHSRAADPYTDSIPHLRSGIQCAQLIS